ncbi:MAG TPA: flagella basal body P-ring formation protein FlgA [Janthinobacterium sp.]|nr:flagella basal body P-ring formation protein FlgA [Janthinobacterium sp.]
MERAARAQLARQAALAKLLEPHFEVTVVNRARPLPACGAAPTVEALDVRLPNRMRFAVVCLDSGPGAWKVEFLVRASISARVAVSAGPVAAGVPLTAPQLALERRDISAIADSTPDLSVVAGMASRRALRAGEVLRLSQLATPPVILRGDMVRIVARRERVEVSMAGEALEAGAPGALLRVRNSTSGTVIRARVLQAGVVEPLDAGLIAAPD